MGTRSVIAMSTETGIQAIYCHWDGYIENNGAILYEHYRDPEKVAALMALGDLSSLNADPLECEAYFRDRGEPRDQTRARTYRSFQELLEEEYEHSDREYVYIFLANGKWAVISDHTAHQRGAQLLSDALAEQKRAKMRAV